MIKNLLLSLLCISTSLISLAQTSVPGGSVSGTWTLSGSPYQIQGSIQILDGQTLIIDPGVTVDFQGHYKFVVSGRLLAIGTAADTITFTASNTTIGWWGIRFTNITTNNDTSKVIFSKLQYGKANSGVDGSWGGAMCFNGSSKALVSNCLISLNNASAGGGGIACLNNSSPIITSNNISNNNNSGGSYGGGGIDCESNSSPIISNNLISYNVSSQGGGIEVISGNPIISNNNISNNNGGGSGGGLHLSGSSTTVIGNIISYNTSGNGGAIWGSGNSTISNNIISNNTCNGNYGGGLLLPGGAPIISNNVITNNSCVGTTWGGGGLAFIGCSATLVNNTISNNSTTGNGGAFFFQNSNPVLRNNILWGNTATISGPQVYLYDEPCDPNFYYCDVQGGSAAFALNGNFFTGAYSNNLNLDPQFSAPSGGSGTGFNGVTANWSLQNTSPCINTGDPNGTIGFYPTSDKAGNPRVVVCYIDMGAFEYQNGVPFLASLSKQNILCNGGTGTATVTTSGGSVPYTYSWSNGQTTSAATGLTPNNYTVTITDGSSCIRTGAISITQPSALTANTTFTATACLSNTGIANVTPSGGVLPYSYSWNNGQTTSVATALGVGNYTATITDANACTITTTVSVSLASGMTLNTNKTNTDCSGNCIGSATVTATSGAPPYTYSWSSGETTSATNSNLCSGPYTVIVTDAGGCSKTATVTITTPSALTASTTQVNVSCNGGNNGSITVNASGGTGTKQYSKDAGTNYQASNIFSGLIAGTYSITVKDGAGCITSTILMTITEPPVLATVTSQVNIPCYGSSNGTVTAIVSGGTPTYTYSWNTAPIQTTATATGLAQGNYAVSVIDNNGCTSTASVTIISTIPLVPICLVTVDSLSKYNIIVWDKPVSLAIDSFIIYRDTANNNYAPIGKIPYSSLSEFNDTVKTLYSANGDPNVSSWRYKIAAIDTCGNISAMSPYHQSIFFQNSSGNFSWNDYQIEGQTIPVPPLSNYLFKRDDLSTGNWVTIQTLSASSIAYTDPQYATYQSTGDWRVQTLWSISCTPSIKYPEPMGTIKTTKSNTFKTIVGAVNDASLENMLSVYPNPSTGSFTIDLKGAYSKSVNVKMYDVFGGLVYEKTFSDNKTEVNCNFARGIYQLQVQTDSGMVNKKIVIE